jgi:hypothetical protein
VYYATSSKFLARMYTTAALAYVNSVTATAPTLTATATGLTSGVTYYFCVSTIDSAGLESDCSPEWTFVAP